jgi:hypothetical protein
MHSPNSPEALENALQKNTTAKRLPIICRTSTNWPRLKIRLPTNPFGTVMEEIVARLMRMFVRIHSPS